MSKLSEPLKALINASHAKPNTIGAPRGIASVYERIAADAGAKNVGLPAWLTASTAATMTLNSPDSLSELYRLATSHSTLARLGIKSTSSPDTHGIYTAELMREIGLKCIGLNGVPRTINCLGAFHASLPTQIQSALAQRPARRHLTPANVPAVLARGHRLWDSIYRPLTDKLTAKLAVSHPDLPVHIIEGEYGCLFSDPPGEESGIDPGLRPNVGRVLMSVAAVACLRAQSGVGPQVVSHVFGLRKAFEDGTADSEDPVEGGRWLASDEGSVWLLELVDRIVEAIGGGQGSNFAPGWAKAKL